MRYGLMSNLRRSWSLKGIRALVDQQQAYLNGYLFSALSPTTGKGFHLLLPAMNSDIMKIFLLELKKQHPNQEVVVVLDNAPCHRRKDLHNIEGLTLVNLPPYSPELNPVERYFEEIRRGAANRVFESLEKCEELIIEAVNSWDNSTKLKQLLGYDWILKQLKEII